MCVCMVVVVVVGWCTRQFLTCAFPRGYTLSFICINLYIQSIPDCFFPLLSSLKRVYKFCVSPFI